MKIFRIKPLEGIDDVRFGMSPEKVFSLWGTASRVGVTSRGEKEEERDGVIVRYDESGVVEFAFVPGSVSLMLGASDLFGCDDPVAAVMALDPKPVECLGFLVFLRAGITLTGYHDDDVSQRAVTTFPKGRWNGMKSHFRKFRSQPDSE